jgi:hypothetical protein
MKGRMGRMGRTGWITGMIASILVLAPVSSRSQGRSEMQRVPQFENDRAVSWKSVIPPHTESTLHRHDRYRTVIAIVGGDLKTVAPDGQATVTHYETGKAYWQEPMPPGAMHKDVNDTDKTIELVVVENK